MCTVVCTAKCSLAQILAGKIQVEDWLMGVGTTYLDVKVKNQNKSQWHLSCVMFIFGPSGKMLFLKTLTKAHLNTMTRINTNQCWKDHMGKIS